MIADEIFNLEIDRPLFDARGKETLKGLLYVRKNEYPFADDKEIIVNCYDIRINGVDIQGDAISLSTRYLTVGFLTESQKTVTDENDKKTKYNALSIKKSAEINEIKTLHFKQEIGASKKYMGVNIYVKDSYSKIKEQIKEIR